LRYSQQQRTQRHLLTFTGQSSSKAIENYVLLLCWSKDGDITYDIFFNLKVLKVVWGGSLLILSKINIKIFPEPPQSTG
jgi:hypothetical protein